MSSSRSKRRGAAVLAYVTVVHLLAITAMVWICGRPGEVHRVPPVPIAFWLVLTLAAELFWLETPTGGGMVSMSLAVNIAALYVLPAHLAVGIAAITTVIADLVIHRRGPLKAAFNASQVALTTAGCATLIRALGGEPTGAGAAFLVREPLAVVSGPVLFFMLNTGLVAGVIGLDTGEGVARAWKRNYGFKYQVLSSATLSLLGLVLVVAVDSIGYIAGMLYLLFFFFVRDGFRRYVESRRAVQARPCRD
jgi:hypothetical protein